MFREHAFLMPLCMVLYVHTVVSGIFFFCNCCINVFVRNMFVSEDELFFSNHSNDLTQLELRLGCLAFFSVLCACFSVIYIFFLPWGILPVGASCDPDETKVCMFPTNLQRSSKPKTTLPVCVWVAGTLVDANSVLVSNQVQYVM